MCHLKGLSLERTHAFYIVINFSGYEFITLTFEHRLIFYTVFTSFSQTFLELKGKQRAFRDKKIKSIDKKCKIDEKR